MTPNHLERSLAGLAAVLLLAPVAAGAAAEPRFEENSQRYELENDEISVWFQGKKPLLKVFPTGNDSRSYQVHMLRIAEFQDEDGDRAYDDNESVAFVNLARADAYDVTTTSQANSVHVELNLNTTIREQAGGTDLGAPQPPIGDEARANITLRFHVYGDERTIDTTGGELAVSPGEVKFDVEVHHWDWQAEGSQLAVVGELPASNDTRAQAGNGTNRVSVEKNGTEIGYTAWQETAEVTTGNGTEAVDVVPTVKEQEENGTVLLAWAYNATGYESLVHDPTVGVTEASAEASDDGTLGGVSDVPAPGAVAAAAAVLGAAAIRRGAREG